MRERKIKYQPLNYDHRAMLIRRGLDPKNYVLVKSTYTSLYIRDIRDGSVRVIHKNN